jgi:hypothetical protein
VTAFDAVVAVNNFGDTRSGGLVGPVGGVVVLILVVVTILLVRNMNGRLRKLPKSFPPVPDERAGPATPPAPAADEQGRPGPV